jgi:hypothetical protein
MSNKMTAALAAVLVLGLASVAQAGSKDDPDPVGGFRVGPVGNPAVSGVNPVYHPSLRGHATETYGYEAPANSRNR